jgi:hypothetical protein
LIACLDPCPRGVDCRVELPESEVMMMMMTTVTIMMMRMMRMAALASYGSEDLIPTCALVACLDPCPSGVAGLDCRVELPDSEVGLSPI